MSTKTIQVTLFLPEALFDELRTRSKLENIPQSELMEQALYEYFDAIESDSDDFLSPESQIEPGERDPNKH